MDLLFNPTSKECKQLLLTSDVHEGPLPYIVNSVALCGGNVDWQHDIILHVLQDQVVDHNIHIVHHTPNQALYITYKHINMRNRLKKATKREKWSGSNINNKHVQANMWCNITVTSKHSMSSEPVGRYQSHLKTKHCLMPFWSLMGYVLIIVNKCYHH